MEVELLIHGVPDGQDYYGIKEEQNNMGLFYDNSTETVKFVVETKKMGDNAYAYYSYLRYKGMIGSGGRPGSYFGITLRIDKFYQDAIHIYNLLDILFKRYVVGIFLTPTQDGYKYVVNNFATKANEIEKIQQALIQLVQTTCVSTKFLDIDNSLLNPITVTPTGNIADITESAVLAVMKKYSKVIISPDYESNSEKECKKKLQEAEGQVSSIVAEKDKKNSEKDDLITSQKKQIASLGQEISRKEAEIQQLKLKGDVSQLLAKIKDPINALANYFRVKEHQPTAPEYGQNIFRLGVLSCALSSIILILCFVSLLKTPKSSTKEDTQLKKQLTELTQENERLKSEIEQYNTNIKPEHESEPKQSLTEPTTLVTTKTLKIDVAGYRSGPLEVGKTYIVSIKEGNNAYNGSGNWSVSNATIITGQGTAKITMRPTSKGRVTLNFTAKDKNCTSPSRDFTAAEASSSVPKPTINITPNTNEVSIGETYTFTVSGYTGKGTWGVDGFGAPTDRTSNSITVKAIDTGEGATKATISYTPDGGSKVTRSFTIKKMNQ